MNDPHVQYRGMLQEIDAGGLGRIKVVPFPVKFSGFKQEIRMRPPEWGEHTGEVLTTLGFSEGEIASLRDRGVI